MSPDRPTGKTECRDSHPEPALSNPEERGGPKGLSSREAAEPPQATEISSTDFPALRSFLRGYFHQDMRDEYGSPEEAAREFCSDASPEERAAVAKEWTRFMDQTQGRPMDEINRILTGPLGSAYSLTDDDVHRLSATLSPSRKARK